MHCIVFTLTLLLFCLEPGVVATPLFDGKLGLRENECLGARKVWGACHVAVDTPLVAPAQIVIYLGLLPFVCLLLPLFILKQTCYSAVDPLLHPNITVQRGGSRGLGYAMPEFIYSFVFLKL
ncbi:hypothetical protein, unlikely [Trypanosoma brucei gambiense DAL972]|uniref:T. brucei spp.-specific protein n=1 Tax=Trypanosoma brucei gambiense (strain MHOM/CI/86/DAL972) TaxID=679716 RepID=C9ZSY1_TRYB9|nr:hypothetical protein, unlikely [Trypanosoma brucei gambiense DAL972]CBH12516.1 hypothetical protein, unlikely [Trypanosoma brucei gambiense DAL972]|eukprot:XP_011774796.1 hypothetical protein, unlikely [Trypanosoma brucei gambiense DAL972]